MTPTAAIPLAVLTFLTAGCTQDIAVDAKYEPLTPSALFRDGKSARWPVPGTVPRNGPLANGALLQQQRNGEWIDAYPFPITRSVLEMGRERYDIYCSPCHGLLGDGQGIVAQRGFVSVSSLHEERAKNQALGSYFDVITNGRGAMYPYGARIAPRERWAVIAYVRVLQRSQSFPVDSLTPQERALLPREAMQ